MAPLPPPAAAMRGAGGTVHETVEREKQMGEYKRLWWTLIGVLVVAFTVLGWMGKEVYHQAPPIPAKVVDTGGHVLMTREQILDGQSAWQRAGGMTVGSIWGHGAYQAPDWTADWLHRELRHW